MSISVDLDNCLLSCNWEVGVSACTSPCYSAAGWDYTAETSSSSSLYLSIVFAGILIVFSGLFSGLTLGLMSLDTIGLQILEDGGEGKEREYARAIMPVRRQGNLLLCTLLLGNTLVNALIAILLAGLTSGLLGGIISTFVIVVFGEIIPQAACSRHGLYIGANTVWLVKFFIVICFPIAWPISKLLDKALGREMGTLYNVDELKKLINIHVENPDGAVESGLTKQDQMLLTGALEYKDKSVVNVMTTLEKVFMLEINARLNFQLMFSIYKSGFTRIPVYESHRQNVVGILFVKDLILVDPDDEIEVRAILAFHGDRSAGYVKRLNEKTTLDRVFKYFKSSYIHLLFAFKEDEKDDDLDMVIAGVKQDGKNKEITGIISLEDVLEEVIQEEIVDETDNYVDVNESTAVVGRRGHRRDLSQFMALFEHKLRKQSRLSTQEINAIAAYLTTNVKVFSAWKDSLETLKGLIKMSELMEYPEEESTDENPPSGEWLNVKTNPVSSHSPPRLPSINPKNSGGGGMGSSSRSNRGGSESQHLGELHSSRNLYRRGKPADCMVLVLQGKVQILAGMEEFASALGPWTVMGHNAILADVNYVPDFDASVSGAARLLVIRAAAFQTALRAAQMEHMNENLARSRLPGERLGGALSEDFGGNGGLPQGSGGEGRAGGQSFDLLGFGVEAWNDPRSDVQDTKSQGYHSNMNTPGGNFRAEENNNFSEGRRSTWDETQKHKVHMITMSDVMDEQNKSSSKSNAASSTDEQDESEVEIEIAVGSWYNPSAF
mmetsp:Transcript_32193/g.44661  ORF Transcript_32193/g.44661 Transcript_32193/m.44661 type:complete len:778 (-) Transcript_32193:255-2588(-)